LHPDVEEIGVKFLYPEGDSLLHVGICGKSLYSQALLKGPKEMDFTGLDIGTVRRMVHNCPAAAP
jgi:hypothetical protein